MKMATFWDIVLCSLFEVDWCFRGVYCFYHCPDKGGSTHLWNVVLLQWDYTVLYARRLSSSNSLLWEPEIYKIKMTGGDMWKKDTLLLLNGPCWMYCPRKCGHHHVVINVTLIQCFPTILVDNPLLAYRKIMALLWPTHINITFNTCISFFFLLLIPSIIVVWHIWKICK
jgi:hypothetical protein